MSPRTKTPRTKTPQPSKTTGTKKGIQKNSRSRKAGCIFPIGRIHRLIRKRGYVERIGNGTPVFLAGVLEYLTAEIMDLAGNVAIHNHKNRITARHIQLGTRTDIELDALLQDVTVAVEGVLRKVEPASLPNKMLPRKPSSKAKGKSSKKKKVVMPS